MALSARGYSYDAASGSVTIPAGNALVVAQINFTADRPNQPFSADFAPDRLVTMLSLWRDAPGPAEGGTLLARSTSFQKVAIDFPTVVAKTPATLHLNHLVAGARDTALYLRVTGSPAVDGAFVWTLIDAHVSISAAA